MNGPRKWLFSLLILTFLSGGAGGLLAERFLFTPVPDPKKPDSKWRRNSWRRKGVEPYIERLRLDEAQTEKLRGILDEKKKKIRQMFTELRPRFKEISKGARGEIRGLLRPEQLAEFEKMIKEEDERRAKYRHHHGRGSSESAGARKGREHQPGTGHPPAQKNQD